MRSQNDELRADRGCGAKDGVARTPMLYSDACRNACGRAAEDLSEARFNGAAIDVRQIARAAISVGTNRRRCLVDEHAGDGRCVPAGEGCGVLERMPGLVR